MPLIPDRATIWPGGFVAFVANPTGAKPLIFDATIREDHRHTWTKTSAPIEGGAQVTDHVQPQPVVFSCDAVLATCPALPVLPMPDRAKVLYRQLLDIANTRTPFDFATTLAAYQSMVFTSIGTVRTAESGDALVCSLVMEQVEIATVDQALVLADAALVMTLGPQNLGSLTPPVQPAAPLAPGITLPGVI